MLIRKRHFIIPPTIVGEQKNNPITRDLYLTEIANLLIPINETWTYPEPLADHMLAYCYKGDGFVSIAGDQIPVRQNQFFIIPAGFGFSYLSDKQGANFYTCHFNGSKSQILSKDFTVVRDLLPSVNNMVANRLMLFDEIFNNLGNGFHNENLEYVSFCFGHLLATFVYACKTSDDIAEEQNPVVRKAISYMESNLAKTLTLEQLAAEAGYSPTYFTTTFKAATGYPPIQYFNHLRIMRACEYLDQTRMKVKEIAFRIGYADPYYFSKDFAKKMGMSPRRYRNRFVMRNRKYHIANT
jgi:AraC-like DNA-binding protein